MREAICSSAWFRRSAFSAAFCGVMSSLTTIALSARPAASRRMATLLRTQTVPPCLVR